ncbi:MAG: AAA domain-containing protein [Candidatus Sericytochromatia bacterium]
MSKQDILSFLNNPAQFDLTLPAEQKQLWLSGLQDIALPALQATGSYQLQASQKEAWESMAEHRVALLKGPPGTGKTFTLSWMATAYLQACMQAGKPCVILVTAFTNNAITNLLQALHEKITLCGMQEEFQLAYLGRDAKNLPSEITTYQQTKDAVSLLKNKYMVLGATIWQVYNCLARENLPGGHQRGQLVANLFDLICIDEASQMFLSHGLLGFSGLKQTGRLVVAGDDQQLPPVSQIPPLHIEGRPLCVSLYTFLKNHRVFESTLRETFRMNEPLTHFSSEKFYDSQLAPIENIQFRKLQLKPNWDKQVDAWMQRILDPESPVVVLLHEGPPCGTTNPLEANIATHIVQILRRNLESTVSRGEFWKDKLAVVTPHRAQNADIRKMLGQYYPDERQDFVVETVDRIQGREREVIMASYTVSDEEFAQTEADFIFSQERFNVTVTRAKTKLVLLISRALVETVPRDERIFERACLLRDFVMSCDPAGEIDYPFDGGAYKVQLRVRRFTDSPELTAFEDSKAEPWQCDSIELNDKDKLLQALIHDLCTKNKTKSGHSNVQVKDVKSSWNILALRRGFDPDLQDGDFSNLQRSGRIEFSKPFTDLDVIKELNPAKALLACQEALIREMLPQRIVQAQLKSGGAPAYWELRNHFAWLDPSGTDLFRPFIYQMVTEGTLLLRTEDRRTKSGRTYPEEVVDFATRQETSPATREAIILSERCFHILNHLEDYEKRRINFGVFEAWTNVEELWRHLQSNDDFQPKVTQSELENDLHQLAQEEHILLLEDGSLRSRMYELARELRYVKQRFTPRGKQQQSPQKINEFLLKQMQNSPYLVRSIRVETKPREKPNRDKHLMQEIAPKLREVATQSNNNHALKAIKEVLKMLVQHWGPEARLAGFQERAMCQILDGWLNPEQSKAYVITADTGSGKTEAALFPMMIGALADYLEMTSTSATLKNPVGTRAILIYPRVQLGSNQAQRIAMYLAGLQSPSLPALTLGLQNKDVPPELKEPEADFPFFKCPIDSCQGDLRIHASAGVKLSSKAHADRLTCTQCTWDFKAWIGSKAKLRTSPPAFFLPVTESLHQWMQDPQYNCLFGYENSPAPRAILADEIHLYSQIHGAQVGYTLQRLRHRIALAHPDGTLPLALGMSATLGKPQQMWGQLIGLPSDGVEPIGVLPDEKSENPRAREYYYFVQPEVESRGVDIAGASTSLQAIMCLAHGIRRRHGGYRGIVFFDSIDKMKRLQTFYRDAEMNKRLSTLRTCLYANPAQREFRTDCCGSPKQCDAFRQGECWFFAAHNNTKQVTAKGTYAPEKGLEVAWRPVFSGTGENPEKMIRGSDLVFSTSSLEVGYDDPDMILVYQHYAPVNLASFIQRKGRGGRSADDRPVTGVTLSIYSPRDSWYFRHPEQMYNPKAERFAVPLNMSNYFVRRGQALAMSLDWMAWKGTSNWVLPVQEYEQEMRTYVERLFGTQLLEEFKVKTLSEMWSHALHTTIGVSQAAKFNNAREIRERVHWVPKLLFSTINLPQLAIAYQEFEKVHQEDYYRPKTHVSNQKWKKEEKDHRIQDEDIALALVECAPGNTTRRYGLDTFHWMPIHDGRHPYMPSESLEITGDTPLRALGANMPQACYQRFELTALSGKQTLLAQIPIDYRTELGNNIASEVLRPIRLPLKPAGIYDRNAEDTGFWFVDTKTNECKPSITRAQDANGHWRNMYAPVIDTPFVSPKSKGFMRGCFIVQAKTPFKKLKAKTVLTQRLFENLNCYQGQPLKGSDTGLTVARVFWGADAELQMAGTWSKETKSFRQIFTSNQNPEQVMFVGYELQTEGIRFAYHANEIHGFAQQLLAKLEQEEAVDLRWLTGQYFRYAVQSYLVGGGLNSFQAGQIAELMVTTAAFDWKGLKQALKARDTDRLIALFTRHYREYLKQHPMLTEQRLKKLATLIQQDKSFIERLEKVMAPMSEKDQLHQKRHEYLVSVIIHGVALRLQQLFIRHGRGDERRVFFHTRLPLQFGMASDSDTNITVFENGSHGDGTTRTFIEHADEAFSEWEQEGIISCHNALQDALFDYLYEHREQVNAYLATKPDPREITIENLAQALALPKDLQEVVQYAYQLLFEVYQVGLEHFTAWDLFCELKGMDKILSHDMKRMATAWELVSYVVQQASAELEAKQTRLSKWSKLLKSYRGLDLAPDETGEQESLQPESRLAEQAYRLSARLCADGCLACLHTGSPLMPDSMAQYAVSRRVLEWFEASLKDPNFMQNLTL